MKTISQLFAGLFFLSNFATNAEPVKTPSVLAWKISSSKSSILILGEMHIFELQKGQAIDHGLAKKAFSHSSIFWIENPKSSSGDFTTPKNSSRLSAGTWSSVQINVRKTIDELITKRTAEERDGLYRTTVSEIDQLSPLDSVQVLSQLALPAYMRFKKEKINLSIGFTASVLNNSSTYSSEKYKFIEDEFSSTRAWHSHCNSDLDTEAAFVSALAYFDENTYKKTSLSKMTKKFHEINVSSEDEDWNEEIPQLEREVWEKCNVLPRNKIWLPKLIDGLEDSKGGQVFLVGISHVVGKNGLLNMLRSAGYTDIQRIRSLN